MATRRITGPWASPPTLAASSLSTPSTIWRTLRDRLHFFVWDADVEFIFEGEKNLDRIHGIDAQLFERRCRW
jgi:uncharacterized protein related to proFAR isomerase